MERTKNMASMHHVFLLNRHLIMERKKNMASMHHVFYRTGT